MITSAIGGFFFRVLAFVVAGLPTLSFSGSAIGAFAEAASWVAVVNHYVPVTTFVACLGVYFTFWLACAVISAILKLL